MYLRNKLSRNVAIAYVGMCAKMNGVMRDYFEAKL